MPMPRSLGSSQVTFLPLMKICPSEASSSPAMQFSRVDLPQPEEPSSTRNSPSLMSRFRSLSTLTAPKFSERSLMETLAFMFIGSTLHCASGDATDEKSPRHEIDDERHESCQDRCGHVDVVFLHALD